MRIEGIASVFPSRIVDNEEILAMIAEYSKDSYLGDLRKALRRIAHLLAYSGIRSRRWANNSETPIDLLSIAIHQAATEAKCSLSDIDLLIYTGVGGGFSEPGNSYMIAHALGINRAQCFDITDACNSWSRALQHSYYAFAMNNAYSLILIVNAEFNMYEGGPGLPALFQLDTPEKIERSFPAYTIGEAATATILTRDESRKWEFHFSSLPKFADLCTIPTKRYEGYCSIGSQTPSLKTKSRIAQNGEGLFTSFATELFQIVGEEAPKIFSHLSCPREEIRLVFPHAVSKKIFQDAAEKVGCPSMYYVYPEYGNLVSASVPAGIYLARKENLFTRGDRLVGWVASAGMSFSAYSFIY